MNYVQLPLYSDMYYEYAIPLEQDHFILTFRWQERTSSWYFDIHKDDLTPVVLGIRLVADYPMLADYQLTELGLNGFFVLEDNGNFVSGKLADSPEAKAANYRLYYVYPED